MSCVTAGPSKLRCDGGGGGAAPPSAECAQLAGFRLFQLSYPAPGTAQSSLDGPSMSSEPGGCREADEMRQR